MIGDMPSPEDRRLEIFLQALEHEQLADRTAYLERECAGDPALRRWVEQELRKQTGSADPERTLISGETSTSSAPPVSPEVEALLAALKPEEPGEYIGCYRLIQQLGEGGFGTVWEAAQEKPVRRHVALKILKPGMDSRQIIGRFEQERQALAMLDHPGIAKVFDAGATKTGRPYFAMELVVGEPITTYSDVQRLTVPERLELLMRVCYAVQHAHQKGIIHRDLKPSNILVGRLNDGSATPKVIDLGLAKATLEMPSEHTLVITQAERMLGTPLYMSPEQAEGSLDVDTRTDIYALGVILYELLTGRTPHDPDELSRQSHDQVRHAIRDQEPKAPSSVLRGLGGKIQADMANMRSTELSRLIKSVRGELDVICMKALTKDRRGRYQTAAALAADLQSHLLDEPIQARPPSQWYRAQKFAARNRGPMKALLIIGLTIVLGVFISVRETMRAKAAEEDAIAAQQQEMQQRRLADQQRMLAERERAAARLNEYVADIGLAQQSLDTGNLGRATQLLDKHRPKPGEPDQRGWGWRYLWQLAQGDEHVEFPNHLGPANSTACSPTGDLFAVGGSKQTSVYNRVTRALVATLPTSAEALSFLPDGKTLVTFARGQIRLWEVGEWRESASWPEGRGPVAFSPDGKCVGIVTQDGIRIRDTDTWKEVGMLNGAHAPLSFREDDSAIAACSSDGIAIWKLDGTAAPLVLDGTKDIFASTSGAVFQATQTITFAQHGAAIVVVDNNPSGDGVYLLRVWNAATGKQTHIIPDDPDRPEHTGAITSVAVSPDGETLATTSLDHSVRLWNLARNRRTITLQGHHHEIGSGSFSPDGQSFFTADRAGRVKGWQIQRAKAEEPIEAIQPLAVSNDGRTLAVLASDQTVTFYDLPTRKAQSRFVLDAPPPGRQPLIAVSAELSAIAQGVGGGWVRLWEASSGQEQMLELSNRPLDVLALTPGGRIIIAGTRGEPLRAMHLQTGAVAELPFPASRVVLSPDGRILAAFVGSSSPGFDASEAPASDEDLADSRATGEVLTAEKASPVSIPKPDDESGTVVLWDLARNEMIAQLEIDGGTPLDAAFSPDGRTFATAGKDNAVRIWETERGTSIGVCLGHKQMVRAVAFAYDGQTLATTGDDSTLRVWNMATQQELLSFQRLGSITTGLLFSPDDQTLVVTETGPSRNKGLRLFRAPLLKEIPNVTSR